MFVCICVGIGFMDLTWEKGWYIWEKFWNVHLFMTEFDCPGVTLWSWQDVKIKLLTLLL